MRRIARVARPVVLMLIALATSNAHQVGSAVYIAPPTLEDLKGDWLGVLGGQTIFFLSLEDKGPSYMIMNVRTSGSTKTILYLVKGLRCQEGQIYFSATESENPANTFRVEGSADYWELDLVLPKSKRFGKRRVTFFRKSRLENGLEAIMKLQATVLPDSGRRE